MGRKSKPKRRSGRGAVLLLAMMLILSATLRIAGSAGSAVAQSSLETDPATDATDLSLNDAGKPAAPTSRDAPLSRGDIGDLLTALREREEKVQALETRIDMRSKALQVADAEITKRLATLEQAEENLRRTLALADSAAEDDLVRLTAVYESMKPKDAAALFETMEPDFAAGFLGRMRPDAAAAVMAGLPPEVAYSISVILAGRNANAPKS